MKRIITGLDIGTSKICAAIIATDPDGKQRTLGVGIAEARGMNKGFVSNLDKLVDAIAKAVGMAEERAGVKAHYVISNISGASVYGKLHESSMLLSRRGREITKRDIKKAIEGAKNLALTLQKDALYAVPVEFIVDEAHEVENPLGLFGTKLKTRLYVVTALTSHLANIEKAVNYAGYELIDIVPTSIATAASVLNSEERSSGALIIDMGGGITELAVFFGESLKLLTSVNVGGMDLTAALSAHLDLPFNSAESIKKSVGGIGESDRDKGEVSVFDYESRSVVVESDSVNELLKTRFNEIARTLRDRLKTNSYDEFAVTNVIMTGGGGLLNGSLECFESLFKTRTRFGSIGDNPTHSGAISLARYGFKRSSEPKRGFQKGKSVVVDTFYKIRELLDEYF